MPRARPADQESLLTAVVSRVRGTPGAVVVFDLDSTLLDNRPRQARILRDYGDQEGVLALRGALPEHWQGWELGVALRNAGLSEADVRAHLAPARRFWRTHFFTSRYCLHDVPLPGAPAYVRTLASEGAGVAYVTGRPASMREGTETSLAQHRFPVPDGDRVRLLVNENPDLLDDDWKALAARRVEALGTPVAAFDNEPTHVNLYALAWPDALVVHLDTDHSGRPVEVLPRVPSIRDFRRAPATEEAAGLAGQGTV